MSYDAETSLGLAERWSRRSPVIFNRAFPTLEKIPNYDYLAVLRRVGRCSEVSLRPPSAASPAELLAPVRSRVGKRYSPETVSTVLEVVMGTDDRVRVTPVDEYPFRCICALDATGYGNEYWSGTGWLVSSRLILTAAHVLFPLEIANWPESLVITPGADGPISAFGSYLGVAAVVHPNWLSSGDPSFDIGAIILSETTPLGTYLGTFGILSNDSYDLTQTPVNLSGYPADKPFHTNWYHSRVVQSITGNHILYDIDTAGGQSGSPVWLRHEDLAHAIGIHTTGNLMGNSGIRISEELGKFVIGALELSMTFAD